MLESFPSHGPCQQVQELSFEDFYLELWSTSFCHELPVHHIEVGLLSLELSRFLFSMRLIRIDNIQYVRQYNIKH